MEKFEPITNKIDKVDAALSDGVYTLVTLLRKRRSETGLTPKQIVAQFEEKFGITISPGEAAGWENRGGPRVPKEDRLSQMAIIYDLPLEDIISARDTVIAELKREKEIRKIMKPAKPKINKEYSGDGIGGFGGKRIGPSVTS